MIEEKMVIELEIRELRSDEEEEWDNYILKSHHSTFYHQIGWRNVISKTYGYKSVYLIVKEDGILKGILPLFFVNNKIISLPFAPYGGICADSEYIEDMLLTKAKNLTEDHKLDYLEIRQFTEKPNFVTNYEYVTFFIPLNKSIEELWKKTRKGARRSAKAAIEHGVEVLIGTEYLDDFYELYAKRNRELGSPIHSYSFFCNILEEFPNNSKIEIARVENKTIGTKLILFFKNKMISGWAASDTKYKKYNSNSLLTWELIKYGCENNLLCFDFGRSEKNIGTYNFKSGWGNASIKQLYYQYYLNKARKVPNISKLSIKRRVFSVCWEKVPLSITKKIGPKIRKNFP